MRLHALPLPLALLPLLPLSSAFKCLLTASDITYDITPLGTLRTTDSETDTPPTRSAARVRMDLCGEGVGLEDDTEDEDQVRRCGLSSVERALQACGETEWMFEAVYRVQRKRWLMFQCPSNARVCLKLTNIKPPHNERVTSVIPFWLTDTSDDDVWTTPIGKKGEEGLKIWVEGPEYAG